MPVKDKITSVKKPFYYAINGITMYRLLATVFLLYLIFSGRIEIFKWFLAFSFFTDMIDGTLARHFKVSSVLGSRLDSVADDLTVVVAMVGVYVFRHEFLSDNIVLLTVLLALYLVQMGSALIRYHKPTSFHTRSAKFAFLLQGCFLILIFFLPEPPMWLFYPAAAFTAIQLIEETILIFMLPEWTTNVKGIYWLMRDKNKSKR